MPIINLSPEKALIFRIVHRDNVPWIFANGMHCRNSPIQDHNYRAIGNPELIDRRQLRVVPIPPGGTLSNYIPFYFTPYTPMMLNIKTGYGGIAKVPNKDVVIFVTSLPKLTELHRPYVFTDRHACLINAEFFDDPINLNAIDWQILQRRDFRRDPEDPAKMERYQAEALVYDHVPVTAFLGLACYTIEVNNWLESICNSEDHNFRIITKPEWYC